MAENFYTILTVSGKNKLYNSVVSGNKINFKTLKLGDGKGAYYEPSENQTSLVNEVWSGNINSISIDENNSNWIVLETVVPATDGGFFIREAGIFDDTGVMVAVSKLAETYKPIVSEGSTKDLCIKIVLEVSNADNITLKVDPNVIVATKNDIEVLESKIQDVSMKLSQISKEQTNLNYLQSPINLVYNSSFKRFNRNFVPDYWDTDGVVSSYSGIDSLYLTNGQHCYQKSVTGVELLSTSNWSNCYTRIEFKYTGIGKVKVSAYSGSTIKQIKKYGDTEPSDYLEFNSIDKFNWNSTGTIILDKDTEVVSIHFDCSEGEIYIVDVMAHPVDNIALDEFYMYKDGKMSYNDNINIVTDDLSDAKIGEMWFKKG